MAKKTTPPPPPVGEPQISPERGLALLDEQIKKWKALDSGGSVSGEDVGDLWAKTKHILERTFGENSKQVKRFIDIPNMSVLMKRSRLSQPRSEWYPQHPDESEREREDAKHRAEDIQERINALRRIRENLAMDLEEAVPSVASPQSQVRGNKIFLVHGHDREMKETTARLLEKLQLDIVIMDEKVDKGKTLIEKLEMLSSDVGYAVVLITADDEGNAKGKSPKPRARQNVIFELGYFIGKLGRDRVCVLYADGVDPPSDFKGVAYHPIDSGKAWRYKLAKELREAEFQANMNLI